MERFVVLKNGGIYNLTSNKKLEVDVMVNNKKIDLIKMSDTISRSFAVMQRKEFIENWVLTLSLMLKNDTDSISDHEDEFISGDLECLATPANGDDVTNYVTAFILGRMFGRFEKNTSSHIDIKEIDIGSREMDVIDNFIKEMEDEISIAESMYGDGYFEFNDNDEETENEDGSGEPELS